MSRQPSVDTQLRNAKSQLRETTRQLEIAREVCRRLEARASKAEREVAEWKGRFDSLLRAIPDGTLKRQGAS